MPRIARQQTLPPPLKLRDLKATLRERLHVKSDCSKKLEADIPAGCTDHLFSKPPQPGKAEYRSLMAIYLIDSYWHIAVVGEVPLSCGLITKLLMQNCQFLAIDNTDYDYLADFFTNHGIFHCSEAIISGWQQPTPRRPSRLRKADRQR